MNETRPPVPPPLRIKPKMDKMVPKLCGGDEEVANYIENDPTGTGDAPRAARLLLAEIEGVPAYHRRFWAVPGSQKKPLEIATDRGRVFLPSNGGSIYIDLDHLELAMPEVRSCLDHEAAMRAMCMLAREAMRKANAKLAAAGGDERIRVRLNNTDGQGNSFGTHLNILVHRDAFRRMTSGGAISRFFGSFCAATTVLGQGKVGSENGRDPVRFQWSQRADFFHSTNLIGEETQAPNRVVWNTRDESHCEDRELARLHCIFYDHVFCLNAPLKVWLLQVALAMEEARATPVDLTLAEPLSAVIDWSHDPGLRNKSRLLADNRRVTSAEWLSMFLDRVAGFLPSLEGYVPDSPRMFQIATTIADLLRRRDYDALSSKLDAFAKLALIRQTRKAHGWDWDAPQLRVIDQLYASLDEDEGIFWQLEAAGAVETLARPERVAHFMSNPPDDTRASLRSKLLQLIPLDDIRRVDWGEVSFEIEGAERRHRILLTLDPLQRLVPGSVLDGARSTEDLAAILNLSPAKPETQPSEQEAVAS